MKKHLLLALFGLFLAVGCNPTSMQKDHVFPRLCGVFYKADEYRDKTGDPKYLYQYNVIRTRTEPEKILKIMEDAPQEWNDQIIWYYTFCQKTAMMNDVNGVLPKWVYAQAIKNPIYAIEVAVFENRKLGVEWHLKDIYGEYQYVYFGKSALLNWHPKCPKGKWDGIFEYNDKKHYIGDTRELTVSQWIPVMSSKVMCGTVFDEAYDGFELDDDPCYGYMPWHIPNHNAVLLDPDCDGLNGLKWQVYENDCRIPHEENYKALSEILSREFLMQIQFHRVPGMPTEKVEPNYKNFTGAKLTCYGGGAGWPYYDMVEWHKLWPEIEECYCLYGKDNGSFNPVLDRIQGSDATLAESRPSMNWNQERIRQHVRCTLASSLVGGNAFFGATWLEDESGLKFINGEHNKIVDIPEMHFRLGNAVSDQFEIYCKESPYMPLYARYFDNHGIRYTVVFNPWTTVIKDIPAEDGVWFEGLWPYLYEKKIEF